jgi:amidase
MDAPELVFAGIARQAQLVRDGEVSPRELVQACLDRIEALDPQLNAFRIVLAEQALAEADAAAARRGGAEDLPLLGVPIAIKDDVDVAGVTTAWGSAAHGPEKERDAEVVKRLRSAGAIVVGKTNVPELTVWAFTESETFGKTRNPWDTERTPGGSSGGTAAAVASGMVGAGTGSDGGGSIRIPSAWCGLFGLKPTRHLVPLSPHDDAWQGLSVNGALTRSVADTALFLEAVADGSFADALRPPGKLTIALSYDRLPGTASEPDLDPEIRAATEATADALRDLGHEVVEREPDYGDDAFDHVVARFVQGVKDDIATMPHPERLEPRTREMNSFPSLPDGELARLRGGEAELRERVWGSLGGADVLLTPATTATAPPVGFLDGKGAADTLAGIAGHIPYNMFFNATGEPAASVPSGFSSAGMPLGVQLAAAQGRDALLLAVAAQLEAARPWADRRPPLS